MRPILLLACVLAVHAAEPLPWRPALEPGVGGWPVCVQISPHDPRVIIATGDVLGLARSGDGGATWQPGIITAAPYCWEMGAVTFDPADPQVVWAGSQAGPLHSADGGRTWTPRRGGMATLPFLGFPSECQKVVYDPATPGRVLALMGNRREYNDSIDGSARGSVWSSTNAGLTWTRRGTIAPDANGEGANIMDGAFAGAGRSRLFVAAMGQGLQRSDDQGLTFTRVAGVPSDRVRSVAVHPSDPRILWVSADWPAGVFRSDDGGATWTRRSSGISASDGQDLPMVAVDESDPQRLFVGIGGGQRLYRSTDGGLSWQALSVDVGPQATALGVFGNWISARDGQVWTLNSVTLFHSRDGGATWRDASTTHLADGSFRGTGWSGYIPTTCGWNPFRPTQVVLQGLDDGKFMSTTSPLGQAARWRMRGSNLGQWGGGNAIAFGGADGLVVVAAFGQDRGWWRGDYGPQIGGLARSVDGGASWSWLGVPAGEAPVHGLHVARSDRDSILALADGHLFRTANGGGTWTPVPVPATGTAEVGLYSLCGDPRDPAIITVAGHDGVYRSSNGGPFARLDGGPVFAAWNQWGTTALAVDYGSPGAVLAAVFNQDGVSGVWRYAPGAGWTQILAHSGSDAGKAWIKFVKAVACDPVDPNHLALVTNMDQFAGDCQATGVWISRDAGATWNQANDGLAMLRGKCIAINPDGSGQVLVGLNGGGFWYLGRSRAQDRLGDLDGSGSVDAGDRAHLRAAFGSTAGAASWNAACDLDGDQRVDAHDLDLLLPR